MNITTEEINALKNSSNTIKSLCITENTSSIYSICKVYEEIIKTLEPWANEVALGSNIKNELNNIKNNLLTTSEELKTLTEHINIFALNAEESKKGSVNNE